MNYNLQKFFVFIISYLNKSNFICQLIRTDIEPIAVFYFIYIPLWAIPEIYNNILQKQVFKQFMSKVQRMQDPCHI